MPFTLTYRMLIGILFNIVTIIIIIVPGIESSITHAEKELYIPGLSFLLKFSE